MWLVVKSVLLLFKANDLKIFTWQTIKQAQKNFGSKSLAPTLIKLTCLSLSSDLEDLD